MKKTLIALLLVVSSLSFGQKVNHKVGISPFGTTFNKGFFFTQGISYELSVKNNIISASTQGSFFNQLDARKRHIKQNEHIPFFNESALSYGRNLIHITNRTHKGSLKINAGYHFLQHGTEPIWDYWFVDSIANDGVRIISGFQQHSASFGMNWTNTKFSAPVDNQRKTISSHSVGLNYLLGIDVSLKAFDDFGTHTQAVKPSVQFPLKRHGVKLSYQFERYFGKHISAYAQVEILYAPFINYQPNKDLFVPRGGEAIYPFFQSIKIGVNLFRFPVN